PGAELFVAVLDFGRLARGSASERPPRPPRLRPQRRRAALSRLHGLEHLRRDLADLLRGRPGNPRQLLLRLRLAPGDLREEEIGDHLEWRPVQVARPPIAYQVQLSEDASSAAIQTAGRFHPLPAFGIEFTRFSFPLDEPPELRIR